MWFKCWDRSEKVFQVSLQINKQSFFEGLSPKYTCTNYELIINHPSRYQILNLRNIRKSNEEAHF